MTVKAYILFCGIFICKLQTLALTVVLDPGHGGTDAGAHYAKTKESDLVLSVAKHVEELLQQNPNFQVHMTRKKDESLSLPERVAKAESYSGDLFISLHANAAVDSRAKGAEIYFQNSVPPNEEMLFLAHQENQILQAEETESGSLSPSKKADVTAILEDLQRQSRLKSSYDVSRHLTAAWQKSSKQKITIRQAPFYVISNAKMPSVLVEIGFLSNPLEARQLVQADYQKEIAQKIYTAVLAYKETVDKTSKATLD